MKLDKLRFGVGGKSAARSSLWVAFHNGSDFYLGHHGRTAVLKISLHGSGLCRCAYGDAYWASLVAAGIVPPSDRAFVKWRRPQTPESGAVLVASLWFPTDFMKLVAEPKRVNKPVVYFDPAPAGQAVQIGIFYSAEDGPELEGRFSRIGTPLLYINLPNGEVVSVVGRVAPFDPDTIPSNEVFSRNLHRLSLGEWPQPGEVEHNLSAVLFSRPTDGQPLHVVEISGLSLTKAS